MTRPPEFIRQWRVEGTLLSPLHIGAGQPLDPFNCVLHNSKLHEFDLSAAAGGADATTRKRLMDRLSGSISSVAAAEEVRTLLKELPWQQHILRSFELSEEAVDKLQKTATWGTWEVMPFIYNPADGRRYIPGSSLKGALRTGVVSERAKDSPAVSPPSGMNRRDLDRWLEDRARKLERDTLGGAFQDDPFSEWFFSDAAFTAATKSVLMAVEIVKVKESKRTSSRRPEQPLSFPHLVETIVPISKGIHFTATVTRRRKHRPLRRSVTQDELVRSAAARSHEAFAKSFIADDDWLELLPEGTTHDLEDIEKAMQTAGPNACVFPLGRFTGFLGKTVSKHRVLTEHRIGGNVARPMKTGDQALPNSRMLTDFEQPFGYVKLEFKEG